MGYLILVAIIVLIGLFLFSADGAWMPFDFSTTELLVAIVGGGIVLVYLLTLLGEYRGRAGLAIRYAAIWIGIFLVLTIAYTFRSDLSNIAMRVASETVPPGFVVTLDEDTSEGHAVRIRRQPNGHFSAHGKVNGAAIRMLIDTGASTVVLSPADAQRAGIDVSSLSHSIPVQTANGTAYAAPVKLRSVSIGSIVINDVEALVTKPGTLNESLLGMSFLRRLRSYEFSGEFLTLKG